MSIPRHNPEPVIGSTVTVLVDPAENNGSDVATAVVTRVVMVNPVPGAYHVVNLRWHSDTDGPAGAWVPSVPLYADDEAARMHTLGTAAFWPSRA